MLIWIDFTCPFCYVGMNRLLPLLKETNAKFDVEIKSFLLNPNTKGVHDYIKSLSEKYNVSYDKAENMTYGAVNLALEDDIKLDFKKLREVNTVNAHKLIKHFSQSEKLHDLVLKIYETYFLGYKNINNLNILEDILKELELDSSNLKEILEDSKYLDEINKDMYQASTFKITSVPSIVLENGKKYIGSRSKSDYLKIIMEAIQVEKDMSN
ncbi:DsbA family oxidoreductase [Miniphocaeibacter massiliensis]|uniref:DsbA family oxidoreductase n=1 Tax=Miniphocaeibacter massiliensis TaxID=2041841 RepID=UPI000C0684DD|nr:DsbA family protein [Miniphocaeibacter massiliensis]